MGLIGAALHMAEILPLVSLLVGLITLPSIPGSILIAVSEPVTWGPVTLPYLTPRNPCPEAGLAHAQPCPRPAACSQACLVMRARAPRRCVLGLAVRPPTRCACGAVALSGRMMAPSHCRREPAFAATDKLRMRRGCNRLRERAHGGGARAGSCIWS